VSGRRPGGLPAGSLLYFVELHGLAGTGSGWFTVPAAAFPGGAAGVAVFWRGASSPNAATDFFMDVGGQRLTLAAMGGATGGIAFAPDRSVAWICNTPATPPGGTDMGGPCLLDFVAGGQACTLSLFYGAAPSSPAQPLGWSLAIAGLTRVAGLDVTVTGPS